MNRIKSFINENLGEVRVVFLGDDYYYVANDVAVALKYAHPGNAINEHVSNQYRKALKYKAFPDLGKAGLWSGNDYSNKILISEAGMWQLVFGSKLKSAIEFQQWIFETVLPSIRKNGGYIDGQENLSAEDQAAVVAKVKSLHDEVVLLNEKLRKKNEKLRESRRFNEMNRLLRKQYKVALNDIDKMQKRYDVQDRYIDYLVDRDADRELDMASLRRDLFLAQSVMTAEERETFKALKAEKANSTEFGCNKSDASVTDRNGFVI